MKFLNLVDENFDILSEVVFDDFSEYYTPSEKVEDLPPYGKSDVIDRLDYGIGVYLPYDDGNDFIVRYINKAILDIYGLDSVEEVDGCLLGDVFPLDVESGLFSMFQECYETGESKHFFSLCYENEELINYYECDVIKSEEMIFLLVKNDTELQLNKLREEKSFHNSNLGIIYIDDEFDVINVNKKFVEILGYNLDEIQGSKLEDFIIEYHNYNFVINNFKDSIFKILNGDLTFTDSKIRVKSNFGGSRWLKVHTSLFKDNIVQCSCSDITGSIKLEETALLLQDTLNSIEEFSKITVLNINEDNYYWTDEICNLLEISPDSLRNNDLFEEYAFEDSYQEFLNLKSNVSAKNPQFNMILKVKTGKGNIKFINSYLKATKFITRKIVSWVGLFHDVTEEFQDKKDALNLKENLDVIQELSKTAIAYKDFDEENPRYKWTKEILNILELDSNEKDSSKYLIEDYVPQDDKKRVYDLIREYVHPDDKKRVYDAYKGLNPENNYGSIKYKIITSKNNIKYISSILKKEYVDGKIVRSVTFIQDITDNVLNENKAMMLRMDLTDIQDISKIAIAHFEGDKFIWTSEIYNILEINPGDYAENVNLVSELAIPEDKDNLMNSLKKYNGKKNKFKFITHVKTPKGNLKKLAAFVKVDYEDGELMSLVGFIQDITD